MAEDAFVTDFEHIMADDITENVRFIMYDSESGKTASAGEVSKYMMKNVHVDTTLTEEGSAADAKAVGGALAKKADTKGRYEDIVAGGAEQLMADGHESDSEPYLFRPTGGSADVGNREYVDKIVGGTVGWNQLVENVGKTTQTINGVTFTALGNGLIRVSGTATADTRYNFNERLDFLKGHVYITVGVPNDASTETHLAYVTGVVTADTVKKYTEDDYWGVRIRVRSGVTVNNAVYGLMCFDLTQMFGSTIADAIYAMEQATAGAGVAWFRRYFPEDYYPYDAGTLKSVQTSAHKTYDADGNVIGTYPLDSSLTLRGVPKLVDGKLAFDGDVYPPSGEVQRRYGVITVNGSSNVTLRRSGTSNSLFGIDGVGSKAYVESKMPNAISDKLLSDTAYNAWRNETPLFAFTTTGQTLWFRFPGITTLADAKTYLTSNPLQVVCELATPTTETADGYEQYQICDPSGTEEYVTTGIVPVGHETRYPHDLKKKIETAPDSPSTDGTYLMKRSGGKNTYMALPSTPSANGAYVLTVTVSGGSASYSWAAKE